MYGQNNVDSQTKCCRESNKKVLTIKQKYVEYQTTSCWQYHHVESIIILTENIVDCQQSNVDLETK